VLKASVSGRIIALDTDPSRRDAALSRGADAVFDPADPEFGGKINDFTGGRLVDRAFEAVGASAPIKTAISLTRKGGSVTLIGNISPTVEIPLQAVVSRQISLIGSCAISGEYPIVLDLMGRKKINAESLISKIAPLAEGQIWFDKLYNREDKLLKVVLIP
jgi:(R,R)-butanediol dehydrogenase/meso-butanediol dehydrogenase/diacetyl reductase/L-iditol 2-dehydrogenase